MPNPLSPSEVKTVVCPQCGGPSLYANSNAYRPFCGLRCKQLDLGAWANEEFKLPEQGPESDPIVEQR